jgi:protein-disulfide isomerase
LTIFSQNDINKICFDHKTAQKIAADLVKGDSAKAELEKTQELASQLKEKIVEQDSIIKLYIEKDSNYIIQIQKYDKIKETQSLINEGLEKDVIKLKSKNERLKTAAIWMGSSLGVLTSVIILLVSK